MDYLKWAEEYWDAANKIGEVINSLTIEIDMINTAKKLEIRGNKNENY